MVSVLFLQPPSPPRMDVTRDYAGGFGVAIPTEREDYGHGDFSLPYLSLMYSAGLLRSQGHDVTYLDAQAERLDAEATITRASRFRPDVIVAVVNLPSIYADGHFLRRLKSRCQGSTVVCIGTVCQVLPDVLADEHMADIVILGEPESILPNLVKSIQDGSSFDRVRGIGVVRDGELSKTELSTEMVDLQTLPWPPHDIMPMDCYRDPHFDIGLRFFPVWASRGCPMPCSFYCPYPVGMGRAIRLRSCVDFVNEIVHLHKTFGVGAFGFRDQMFSSDLDRAEEICDLLINQELKIQWFCETRFDRVSKGLLQKMRKAGCKRVHFGLETGDSSLLRKVGKPGMKISTVKKAVRMTKEAGIQPLTHLILGLPGESRVTVNETHKTLREMGIANISVNLATPYPGTPMHQYAKEQGLLETEDWSRYTSFNAVMRTESMSTQDLEESRRFIRENLLGSSFQGKMLYLCKNGDIISVLRTELVAARGNPLSLLRSLRRHAFWNQSNVQEGDDEIRVS